MRTPTDMRQARGRRPPGRGRIILVVAVVAFILLAASLRGIAGFYTDYLWFDSLGQTGVWSGVIGAKVVLALIFTTIFFLLLWVNLFIADRLAPKFRQAGPEEDLLERYYATVGQRPGLTRFLVSIVFAAIAGLGVANQWREWILFTNAKDFGVTDAQFDTDIGFYVFRLPFLNFLTSWTFTALVIVLLITAVAHYLNGGIRLQAQGERVTPQVKAHLSVLLGLLALARLGGYYLQQFDLTRSTRGAVDGATFTDVNAQLPAIRLLMLIAVFSFLLFIVNIWRRGWVLPVLAVGLWAFVSIVAGRIYPAFVQRFQVEPAESTKEAKYIERNIEATRAALGLDEVEVRDYEYKTDLDPSTIRDNAETVDNIRLLDPNIVKETFNGLQRESDFYEFFDLDVDRYEIDGRLTQMVLSARGLNEANIPQRSWENLHLAYTHGYGLAAAPMDETDAQGRPNFVVRGAPIQSSIEGVKVVRPEIYFGEDLTGYAIVRTDRAEIDYVAGDEPATGTYEGGGGVQMSSFVRKAAFALRFGRIDPLISDLITDESRILYVRDVRDRVSDLAPFLHFDADPYPVVNDGRLVYVIDGYTTSDRYPNAQQADTTQLPSGSGLLRRFNYVRNSVKAVVDAYEGDVKFYVVDDEDPIAQAYVSAFPDLFTDGDELPAELRAHTRYPEDLFRAQTNMWGRYRLTDSDAFYSNSGAWTVALDPSTAVTRPTGGSATTTGQQNSANVVAVETGRSQRIEPYYQIFDLPGDEADRQEFVMTRPFQPFGRGRTPQLNGFMVARSDGDDYGKLVVYELGEDQPDAPANVAAAMESTPAVARETTLLSQAGSQIKRGNLIMVPIDDNILYVRPLYVEAQQTANQNANTVPTLRFVIVYYDEDVAIARNLDGALNLLFRGSRPEAPDGPTPTEPTEEQTTAQLLASADQLFAEAQAALEAGDLGVYQEKIEEARDLVRQALEQVDPDAVTTTTTAPPGEA